MHEPSFSENKLTQYTSRTRVPKALLIMSHLCTLIKTHKQMYD
uniref:Uncharacterized protein n=1 Tax=Anguilla anguilla TaxID=7936 RepID=A0A0E9XGH5_ANGAN